MYGLAVNGQYIYWGQQGQIARANLDGTGVIQNFIPLALGAQAPSGVALDGTHILWTSGREIGTPNTIGRANLDGTAVNESFITGADGPWGIAVVPPTYNVFWATAGDAIGGATLDSTGVISGMNETLITGASTPKGVSADGTHVYWANETTGTIGRANLNGTDVNESFIGGATQPLGVAVNATNIFWTNALVTFFGVGEIGRANLDGTGVSQTFINVSDNLPTDLAVYGDYLYWGNAYRSTNGGAFSIGRAKVNGTGVNTAFITLPVGSTASGITAYGQYIYWADDDWNTIARANLDGTAVNESFIAGANTPQGVVVDGAYILWVNEGDGTIGRANIDGTAVNQSFMTANASSGIATVPKGCGMGGEAAFLLPLWGWLRSRLRRVTT